MTALPSAPMDWTRMLAVVAHPDDMEYGAAMAVARFTQMGRDVRYIMVTSGEAGIDSIPPAEAGPLREAEEVASASVVGVDVVDFLRLPDGHLEHNLALRAALARSLRIHRPDVVITINHHQHFSNGMLNQADHRAVGSALLDAVRDAANRWIFPDQILREDLTPCTSCRQVWVAASPQPTHAIDVTGFVDKGLQSLAEHRVYLDNLDPSGPDQPAMVQEMARQGGALAGTDYAIPIEVISL
ncbi:MAG: PIG-L family deacetylase [Acidimicrobiia bacterium]|nr:PIG-L family deacetylase [Acidimicrobiia bacterium]